MPRGEWTDKQERQYEHIKDSAKQRGASTRRAKEIAARTVQKERSRKGQTKTSSRLSRTDVSSSRRGGLRSHGGPRGRTRDQLYTEAKKLGVKGRSTMNKDQLRGAVDAKKR
jgi:plasmid stabilization system protein ParE